MMVMSHQEAGPGGGEMHADTTLCLMRFGLLQLAVSCAGSAFPQGRLIHGTSTSTYENEYSYWWWYDYSKHCTEQSP
eukprot:scaffold116289_cov31-Prasinocladus_malaysianus.AAC.3